MRPCGPLHPLHQVFESDTRQKPPTARLGACSARLKKRGGKSVRRKTLEPPVASPCKPCGHPAFRPCAPCCRLALPRSRDCGGKAREEPEQIPASPLPYNRRSARGTRPTWGSCEVPSCSRELSPWIPPGRRSRQTPSRSHCCSRELSPGSPSGRRSRRRRRGSSCRRSPSSETSSARTAGRPGSTAGRSGPRGAPGPRGSRGAGERAAPRGPARNSTERGPERTRPDGDRAKEPQEKTTSPRASPGPASGGGEASGAFRALSLIHI